MGSGGEVLRPGEVAAAREEVGPRPEEAAAEEMAEGRLGVVVICAAWRRAAEVV
jgi:hypothetical protein